MDSGSGTRISLWSARPRVGQTAANRPDQILRQDGLSQEAIGLERFVRAWLTGDDDDRNVARDHLRAEFCPHDMAVNQGKPEIEHDDVRGFPIDDAQRTEAVARLQHTKPREAQRGPIQASECDIVLNE